jgi:hypothetical protein
LSRLVKVLLFLGFFFLFFEAGLLSSYTIVTGNAPDMDKLIGMQIDAISSIFNFGGNSLDNKKALVILNKEEVVEALKTKAGMDGINTNTLVAYHVQNNDNNTILVNITAMLYKDVQIGGGSKNSTRGQIVISPQETYSVTATAIATKKNTGITVDVDSIQVTSTRKLYNTNKTS